MNIVIFSGRLARDLEFYNYGTEGNHMTKLTIAVNEMRNKTNYFELVAFGKVAENLERCGVKKGSKITVQCKANQNNYTDKNGTKHYTVNFTIVEFSLEESKEKSEGGSGLAGDDNDFLKVPEGSDDNGYPFEF